MNNNLFIFMRKLLLNNKNLEVLEIQLFLLNKLRKLKKNN